MTKTLTLVLFAGDEKNEETVFSVRLADAVLKRGHNVNMVVYENGCKLAKREPTSPDSDDGREESTVGPALKNLANQGAFIATCSANHHDQTCDGLAALPSVDSEEVGHFLTDFLLTTDVLLTVGH